MEKKTSDLVQLKGIIFDFNGVIVDDYVLQKEVWSKMSMKLRGKPLTDDEMINNIRGKRSIDNIRLMVDDLRNGSEIKKLTDEKERMSQKIYQSSPFFRLNKGLETFLNNLQKREAPRTIATSLTLDSLQICFDRLELNRWFELEKTVYNDGKHQGKPAPDAYLLAAEKLQLKPAECVVFEDALSGIKSAYAAGVRFIVAVGSDRQLPILTSSPGVVKGIRDFTKITLEEIF